MKNKKLTKSNGGGNFIAYHHKHRKGAATEKVVAFYAKGGVKLFDSMTHDRL